MKVSTPVIGGGSKQEQPPLSLVPDENEDYVDTKSAHCSIFKLRTNPTDPASALYSFSLMKIDGTQSLRAHIRWIANVKKIHRGLGLDATASVRKHTLNSELCSGEVKTAYENGVSAGCQAALTQLKIDAYNGVARAVGQSDVDWKAAQQAAADLITDVPDPDEPSLIMGYRQIMLLVAPYKSLEKQKRYMRRKMRKPADMKTRTYVQHLYRINRDELPALPPGNNNQALPDDEVKDIITYGLPRSWTRRMDEFDFDPYSSDIAELVAFCERLESAEDFDKGQPDVNHSSKKSGKKPRTSKHKSSSRGDGDKWCDYHETNTHNTSECDVLKKLKASKGDGGGKPSFKNKTWKRKSDDASKYSKKELAAIGKAAGKKAIKAAKKRALYAISENGTSETEHDVSSDNEESDMDSVASINMLERGMADIDQQLKDFDFAQMDGNKSDGEVSC